MRVLLTLITSLTAIFALCIGMIRAQPYDSQRLRVLFHSPGDCLKPCWRGIRPGSTTVDDALHLLQSDDWIDAASIRIEPGQVYWQWSGQQSALLDPQQPGTLHLSNQRVFSITLPVNIGIGDFHLLYGRPFWGSRGRFRYEAFVQYAYPRENLSLLLRVACPMRSVSYWHAQPEVTLSLGPLRGASFTPPSSYLKLC